MNISKIIADRPWRSSWPSEIVEATESNIVPDVSWKGQISRYKRIFQAMAGTGGSHCGVSEIVDLVRKMENWSARHDCYLSWPPTLDGWSRAVWATMSEPQGKEDMAWLWAAYAPHLARALSVKPSPHSWAVSLLQGLPVESPTSENATNKQVESSNSGPVDPPGPRQRAQSNRKEREVSPDILETRKWLVSQLSDISSSKDPEGIVQERFDQAIKDRITLEGRPGPRMQAGWIEYRLIPAVAGLDDTMINLLVDFWPQKHSRSFIDPVKTLTSPRLWGIIEDTIDQKARSAYIHHFLPRIIDASEWSSSARFQIGVAMFDWTQKRPEAFSERLALWRAWGGKMEDSLTSVAEGNRFTQSQVPAETMGEWIASKENPEWDRIASTMVNSPRNARVSP